jgi:hypothetical protein
MAVLNLWTVYDHPLDYPEWFVARRFELVGEKTRPTLDIMLSATLEGVREKIPRGLYCMPRFENDEPQIVEVWL